MSAGEGRASGMELEQLLNTLSDPFTTKKQIPRTPESLSEFLRRFVFEKDLSASLTILSVCKWCKGKQFNL